MKIIAVIPARYASTRFPAKLMQDLGGKTIILRTYQAAIGTNLFDDVFVVTDSDLIYNEIISNGGKAIMSIKEHESGSDRIAEAITTMDVDVVVNVQGDEPMMHPEMFDALIEPMLKNDHIKGTILGMLIEEEEIWRNPDTVKLIHNDNWEVLYTTRAAVPYNNNKFSLELKARRIYGLFAFRWKYLKQFSAHPETRLEKLESCDSNRTLDMDFRQYVAPYPFVRSYSVDNVNDINIVEAYIREDKYWGKY